MPGFIFESNRGTKHSFTAETSLGPEFSAGWAGKKGKRLKSKLEALKQKASLINIKKNTWELYHRDTYFWKLYAELAIEYILECPLFSIFLNKKCAFSFFLLCQNTQKQIFLKFL